VEAPAQKQKTHNTNSSANGKNSNPIAKKPSETRSAFGSPARGAIVIFKSLTAEYFFCSK